MQSTREGFQIPAIQPVQRISRQRCTDVCDRSAFYTNGRPRRRHAKRRQSPRFVISTSDLRYDRREWQQFGPEDGIKFSASGAIFMLRAHAARKLLQLLSYRRHAAAVKPVIRPSRYTATTAQESSRGRSRPIYFSNHWLFMLRCDPREKLHCRI